MTMRLTIKNEDQSRTAVVTTFDTPGRIAGTEIRNPDAPDVWAAETAIAPSESAEFWIHSGRMVRVTEKQG